ncbi:MaoC/PaaZ C-terminal domain-containing protein [Cupriavidus alkaliphilus]|uniref:MaoC/PaaZ C-terminal domain-containing protein n=1 Tax=Cupriavidus alkaliphilus TaxID=942866 RepID=UPI0016160D6C|nr:MaoC/PaaZ C-terminal domain-containing protein [Cupriavidus alkaliphilus]MBB2919339.1 acyl dehydratase [Cupriavidus alkaliphilus]
MASDNLNELSTLKAGDALTPMKLPPISRTSLALYAGASGDHNPMHIDIDFARAAGLDDVFAHGMLSAGYVGRLVTDWAGADRLRSLTLRFIGITNVHDVPHLSGKVAERFVDGGEMRLRIDVECANQNGEVKVSGQAVVALG